MHEPRLNRALRELLQSQRIASLGTLNAEGGPFVSMVPFAVDPGAACLVVRFIKRDTK
ncbi:pyridoxamine 5'-phosphate oxidase family protein [Rhodoferax sp.]|uniref:pyridoxamine 5'-phosphate oxidase family protein n=1 Tax=Rhodoferax sp. TaxID=50421 RepID=UPI003BB70F24